MSMHVVVLAEPNHFELRADVAIPRPAPNRALLRVKSTTICGTDEKILAGLFSGTKFPHIPGHEFSGAVVVGQNEEAVERTRLALGGDGGADLVIEFAGTPEAARQAIQLARRGGRVVLAGATGPGRELSGVDLSTIVRGHLDIYGSWPTRAASRVAAWNCWPAAPWTSAR